MTNSIKNILAKAEDMGGLSHEEVLTLLRLPLCSRETYEIMATANLMSRMTFGGKGERHFHIGLNVQACKYNCKFCSLTEEAGIFKEPKEFSDEQVLAWARQGQEQGADAFNLMTTGQYPLERLLEIGRWLRGEVSVPLVANTRDISHAEGEALLAAGFSGFYHAIRLGEGVDTPFPVEKRLKTIKVLRDVGLRWMNCVEPVGPEHQPGEIARVMLLAREYRATYTGVMRRINFPGAPLECHGMINELQMARLVAVSRLVMGDLPRAHCTHEPNSAALMAGANLFFPEVGSSPRDQEADTGQGRGKDLAACGAIMREMGWDPDLASNCFSQEAPALRPEASCSGELNPRA